MPAITVENVSKKYRKGQFGYRTLREDLYNLTGQLIHLRRGNRRSYGERYMWALKDVSFQVEKGEKLGIIGANGCGKTTMLRLLAGITNPTEGKISLKGRMGVLIELMAGFHPELTGRENIFLNGAIMGLTRKEIRRKFDEIVAFADIEDWIDTPIKRYSSGMHVRLGFAVSAHLDPDILLVDEVLAVGDANFQKKCLGKMEGAAQEGRTVVFVSHNMASIIRLCPRAILLDEGKVLQDGPSNKVISGYLNPCRETSAACEWPDTSTAPGNDVVRLRAVRVRREDGQIANTLDIRHPVAIEMEYEVLKSGYVLVPNYHFYNEEGDCIFISSDVSPAWRRRPREVGRYISAAWIPGNYLSEGEITVRAAMSTMDPVRVHFDHANAVAFHVVDSLDGDSARGDYIGPMPGFVRPLLRWDTQFKSNDQDVSGDSKGETVQ